MRFQPYKFVVVDENDRVLYEGRVSSISMRHGFGIDVSVSLEGHLAAPSKTKREQEDAAAAEKLSADIEFDLFRGKADFSGDFSDGPGLTAGNQAVVLGQPVSAFTRAAGTVFKVSEDLYGIVPRKNVVLMDLRDRCECGAAALGEPRGPAHSSWCPWR